MGRVTPGILTRRLCGATLLAQSMSIFFGALVAWRLGQSERDERAELYLIGGLALAVLCVVAVGALRTRYGIALGWLVQVLTLACAVVLPAMVIVAGIFGTLWFLCVRQGRRMDEVNAQREAQARLPGEGEG
jgi:chromate transport protein ChrA